MDIANTTTNTITLVVLLISIFSKPIRLAQDHHVKMDPWVRQLRLGWVPQFYIRSVRLAQTLRLGRVPQVRLGGSITFLGKLHRFLEHNFYEADDIQMTFLRSQLK